jgi:hypothetical protein
MAAPAKPFERLHHRRIGRILASLDAVQLRANACWFAGGTAVALRLGEYRESVDMDFMVSDRDGYRELRQRLMETGSLEPITRANSEPITLERALRGDQYGIRTFLLVDGVPLKFEIVHEGRIKFGTPGRADKLCGIYTLARTDLAASKFLANSDRWRDDSIFSRDILDLAMLDMPPRHLKPALHKAMDAYGAAAVIDVQRALQVLRDRPERLLTCMHALSVSCSPAFVQQRLRNLSRRLAAISPQREKEAP